MPDDVEVECVIKIGNEELYHGQATETEAKRMFHQAVADMNLRNTWTPTNYALYIRKRHMRGRLRLMTATVPAPVALPN